jgi:hypothetical protein
VFHDGEWNNGVVECWIVGMGEWSVEIKESSSPVFLSFPLFQYSLIPLFLS